MCGPKQEGKTMWVERGVCDNEDGYCKLHDPRALLCGHATKSGSPCKLLATECPHHGEHRIPMSDRTEPSIFRVENLRFDKWNAVKEYRDGLDVYSNMKVGEVTNQDQKLIMSLNYMSFETTLTSFRNKALAFKRRNKTWPMCCAPTL